MTESLPIHTHVSLRHDGKSCRGVIVGRAHVIPFAGKIGGWVYDLRLADRTILQNVEAEKILRVVKEQAVA